MIIRGLNKIASAYGATFHSSNTRQTLPANSGFSTNIAERVSISNKAREALAASNDSASMDDQAIKDRLASIRAKGPINRSQEDQEFLFANDKRLAAIKAQGKFADQLTADDLDYMQKATGLVNTFANLSSAEKALYDKAVASGNADAAAGIAQIAMVRMKGPSAGCANGTAYDPLSTEMTRANIEKYFSNRIVDSTGNAQSHFQALMRFLQTNPAL